MYKYDNPRNERHCTKFDVTDWMFDWIRVAVFFRIHPFLYELKMCYLRKCDCCVEKKIITWICENHFWHLRRFVTQNHARTKKKSSCTCIYFCVVTHRGLLQYIKLLQNVWYVILNYNPIYIYFPINISSKGAMMKFLITIFVTSFTH